MTLSGTSDSAQVTLGDRTVGKMVAADQWAQITEVLHQHLDGHLELLDALLIDLANLQPAYETLGRQAPRGPTSGTPQARTVGRALLLGVAGSK